MVISSTKFYRTMPSFSTILCHSRRMRRESWTCACSTEEPISVTMIEYLDTMPSFTDLCVYLNYMHNLSTLTPVRVCINKKARIRKRMKNTMWNLKIKLLTYRFHYINYCHASVNSIFFTNYTNKLIYLFILLHFILESLNSVLCFLNINRRVMQILHSNAVFS